MDKKIPISKFGEHLIFDGYGCNPAKLDDEKICTDTLMKLSEIAGMHILHEPVMVHATGNETLGGKDPGGYSGFLMIMESHISIHTFTKRGFLTIDLYSCKEFNSDGIVDYIKETFECQDEQILKLERGMKYPTKNLF